jgi:hypothetical protein
MEWKQLACYREACLTMPAVVRGLLVYGASVRGADKRIAESTDGETRRVKGND